MEDKDEKTSHELLFAKEREDWKDKISKIANDIRGIQTVATAQVDLFTNRQLLLEYSYKLAQVVSTLNGKLREKNAFLLRQYSEKNDIRYQATEKKTLIEGELSGILGKIEMVESHRKFIDQTIQTVDHMLYGIKQRISLEEYLRASTIK